MIQQAYNEKHGVVPTAVGKNASNSILSFLELSRKLKQDGLDTGRALEALPKWIDQLETRMKEAAKKLDFEEASNIRDRVKQLRQKMDGISHAIS